MLVLHDAINTFIVFEILALEGRSISSLAQIDRGYIVTKSLSFSKNLVEKVHSYFRIVYTIGI